ncbi:MAG: DUF308 domain-containing protein [Candidatus Woesebacteria bacterium]|jgi:uncharacterized membrane protein HdeD (DUF308 family)
MAAKTSKKTVKESTSVARTALVLHGIAAIIFGIAAVFWPGLTTVTLVYILAAFLMIDGVIALVWGLVRLNNFLVALLTILLGLVELGAGLYLVREPALALATLIIILGLVLVVRGVIAFVHMFTEKDLPSVKAMHGIQGFLGIVVGIFILAQPVASGLAFVWVLGFYALIAGAVMIAMSSVIYDKR